MKNVHQQRLSPVKVMLGLMICSLLAACEPTEEVLTPEATWIVADGVAIDFYYSHAEMFEFNIDEFLNKRAGHLLPYAETISHVAAEKRISPRLIIALMEQQSGALSNPAFNTAKPFGDLSELSGFLEQMRDVCSRFRAGDMHLRSGTPQTAILSVVSPDDISKLRGVYHDLFPGVVSNERVTLANVAQVDLQFPFPIGDSWVFGGAHGDSGDGRIFSSLDFMDPNPYSDWGDTIKAYVVNSASGRAKVHSSCYVEVVHDGGWSTSYYHMDHISVKTGQNVPANLPLGKYANSRNQALCDGGSSTGPHLHWSLYRSGKEVDLDGIVLSGWTVHPGTSNYDDNCSRMYLTRDGKKKCPWRGVVNEGFETCDDKCSASCPCGEGEGDCNTNSDCKPGLFCEQVDGEDSCKIDPSSLPYIEMSKSKYAVNEKIVVRYYNLPGGNFDWVGVFKSGTAHTAYLDYVYSNGASNGTMEFAGLSAGKYDARLFFDDTYNLEDEIAFAVGSDVVDNCPNDPKKTEPGICGCGTPDTDSDGDGTVDCQDNCPSDMKKTEPGICGCGTLDTDRDADGTADCKDNCPDDSDKTEPGNCGCGAAEDDSCENGNDLPYKEPFSSQGGSFKCMRNTCTWTSAKIDTTGVAALLISAHVQGYTYGVFEQADYLKIFYRVDNGSWKPFFQHTDDLSAKTVTKKVSLAGDTLEMKIESRTSASNETYEVDNLTVQQDGGVTDQCPDDPSKTEPGECGCGVPEGSCDEILFYEAEDRTAASSCNERNNHAGFTGDGFMDYGGGGSWIEWNNITVSKAGNYSLTFRYANGGGAARVSSARVNSSNLGDVQFANTGGWKQWRTDTITVPLKAGKNTIRIVANTSRGGPNLDNLEIE